jgi:TldD protein
MPSTRRRFLRQSSLIAGAAALPSWLLEREAAAAAAVDRAALADAALQAAKAGGASYADVRVNRYRFEAIVTREQQVQAVQRSQSFGLGVRVLVNGTWGFAASRVVTPAEAKRMANLALEIAKANAAHQRKRIELVPAPKVAAKWRNAYKRDPFEVSLGTKTQFLMKLNETAMKVKGVSFVNSSTFFVKEEKFLARATARASSRRSCAASRTSTSPRWTRCAATSSSAARCAGRRAWASSTWTRTPGWRRRRPGRTRRSRS